MSTLKADPRCNLWAILFTPAAAFSHNNNNNQRKKKKKKNFLLSAFPISFFSCRGLDMEPANP